MKNLLLIALCFSTSVLFGQQFHPQEGCASEQRTEMLYAKFPAMKAEADAFNAELARRTAQGKSVSDKNIVYEIPVVVHLLNDGSALGTAANRSDQQIIDWLEYTKQVLAGTSTDMLGEGNGGASVPVKLVLAKTGPNCLPTNGIHRVDLSGNAQYVQYGINSATGYNGVPEADIVSQFGWDPTQYYNIYISKIVLSGTFVAAGYASFAGTIPMYDNCFIMGNAVNTGQKTMAHEFGHALGLWHTQQGSSGSACASNTNCLLSGDLVCDTEPITDLLSSACPTGSINPCTGALYGGTEQNVMGYTSCVRNRFTAGQQSRAIAQLLQFRSSLLSSPALLTIPPANNVTLTSACVPTYMSGSNGDHHAGISMVKFGNISNYTETYNVTNNLFYRNYASSYCFGTGSTVIPLNAPTQLTLRVGFNAPHAVKVYIDYNNNGVFDESSEMVFTQTGIASGATVSASITPPSGAVLNTPLRMRVKGDFDLGLTMTACSPPVFG